ncbi:AraC family transcriptional regulator [Sphingobacterium daejeonense]|uniref:AraC family transcriptional regulator n=1 Tax=Sphingobacterium daejeonense TaxID=371142 RepID=UPI0010C3FFAF|nr:helix-turn-helix domain-containing protein [Sphingobacterium daejeonense]VTP98199.1 DNA-binding transcriptional activator FeaR [Sphingobacterium daejeonense]
MLVYFIYSAIIVLCLLSYQLYLNLAIKGAFEKVLSYLILVILFHIIFAAMFRDIIPGYRYVDIGAPFGLLYGPFLYIGYLAFKRKDISNKTIIIHAIPFLILTIVYIIFLSNEKLRFQYGKLYYIILYSLFGLSWMLYPASILIKGKISDFKQLDVKRLYYYFMVLLLVLAAFIIPTIMSTVINKFDVSKPLSGLTVYIIMMLGISMVYNFLLKLLISQTKNHNSIPIAKPINAAPTTIYSVKLSPDLKHASLKGKILLYLEDKKYLDPEFNLNTMAKDLKLSRSVISQFFKENFNQNVLKTINALRIEEVCQELNKPDFDMNIDELAYRCGFSSRASFYRNFSIEKNCTPIEYREMCLQN